jgi:hypothetical protein
MQKFKFNFIHSRTTDFAVSLFTVFQSLEKHIASVSVVLEV